MRPPTKSFKDSTILEQVTRIEGALIETPAPETSIAITKEMIGWLLAGLAGIFFVFMVTLLPTVMVSGAITASIAWVPSLGLTLALYLDGLALLFALIVLGVGATIALYAGYYFETRAAMIRFAALLVGFMGAMLGVVLSGNVLTLFIAWEATSILSFLLIAFDGERESARAGALQALIITGGGGLALLVGLVLMGTAGGSMQIADLLANPALRESPWYAAFTLLIIVGCFSKSAQFPFHFWLPGAMSAPTPASAYLHSATMVKAGVYLLLRLAPTLGDTALWETLLVGGGLLTMGFGALWALRQTDLKAMLAYATISQLGALVALIGLPHGEGVQAAAIGILAHSLYKAALFMIVGAIDHHTGTRDLRALGGLRATMPGWAIAAGIAGLSMAGIPPLLGFVAKEALLESLLSQPIALLVVGVSAALSVALALILVLDVFGGAPHQSAHNAHVHALPGGMLIAPAALVGLSLLAGLLLPQLVEPLISAVIGADAHLALWHGINTPLIVSTLAIAAGVGIYATRATWRGWALPTLTSGAAVYAGALHGVERLGDLLLRSQNGKLRTYLAVILIAVVGLQAAAGLAHITEFTPVFEFRGALDILRVGLLVLALATMLASILFRKHLIAALALGVSGYSVGGLFLLEPAPDVALVQFMVETLGTVLLIIMLARIAPEERQRAMDLLWVGSRAGLVRDIAISLAVGGGVALFALAAVSTRPKPESIATWHLENTLAEVGFPDVVGAIVTDFRGLDTIIEITVFSIAALGVLTIIARPARLTRVRPHTDGDPVEESIREVHPHGASPSQSEADLFVSSFSTPMTRVISTWVLPFSFLVALAQLLYGGDGPGDGFTAGVISGLGVALWYVVFGYHDARTRLGWLHERRLIGVGLMLVILNAAYPLLVGEPFAAHLSYLDQIPLPAGLHLTSTFVYETGIFLTILGSVTTVMEAIAYPKEVEAL